ncbi:uncharacterized protein V6R79_020148 [Siganus canaliculatus]
MDIFTVSTNVNKIMRDIIFVCVRVYVSVLRLQSRALTCTRLYVSDRIRPHIEPEKIDLFDYWKSYVSLDRPHCSTPSASTHAVYHVYVHFIVCCCLHRVIVTTESLVWELTVSAPYLTNTSGHVAALLSNS